MIPKTFQQIMGDMIVNTLKKTSIEDLESGSVLKAAIEGEVLLERLNKQQNLIKFLTKLDGRFRKYYNPWGGELKLAQRYFQNPHP